MVLDSCSPVHLSVSATCFPTGSARWPRTRGPSRPSASRPRWPASRAATSAAATTGPTTWRSRGPSSSGGLSGPNSGARPSSSAAACSTTFRSKNCRRMFREVVLVDLIHPFTSRWATRKLANVKRVEADVTGTIARAYAVAWDADEPLPKSEPTLYLDDPEVDFTASVNLLSQLPCMPMAYLQRQNVHRAREDRRVRPRPDPGPPGVPRPHARPGRPRHRLRAAEDQHDGPGRGAAGPVLRAPVADAGRGVGVEAGPVPGGGPEPPLLPAGDRDRRTGSRRSIVLVVEHLVARVAVAGVPVRLAGQPRARARTRPPSSRPAGSSTGIAPIDPERDPERDADQVRVPLGVGVQRRTRRPRPRVPGPGRRRRRRSARTSTSARR